MLKKFAVTLIVLSTLVYGSLFLMAVHYGTSFFDEILFQLNRVSVSLSKKQEVTQSKLILRTILENEHPPDNWKTLIVRSEKNDHKELFYYYKIWTIKARLSMEDINDSYPVSEFQKNNFIIINMRYGNTKPLLQFPFSTDKKGHLIAGLFFPVNEAPLSADYNKDKRVNHEDVVMARKAEAL